MKKPLKHIKSFDQVNEAKKSAKKDSTLSWEDKKKFAESFVSWSDASPDELHWDKEDEDDEPGIAFFLDDNYYDLKPGKRNALENWVEKVHNGQSDAVDEWNKCVQECGINKVFLIKK